MPALHVRNVDDAVIERLKRRAEKNRRSLEAELRVILDAAAGKEARPTGRRRRKLRLHLVSVGGSARYGRDEIYGDDER